MVTSRRRHLIELTPDNHIHTTTGPTKRSVSPEYRHHRECHLLTDSVKYFLFQRPGGADGGGGQASGPPFAPRCRLCYHWAQTWTPPGPPSPCVACKPKLNPPPFFKNPAPAPNTPEGGVSCCSRSCFNGHIEGIEDRCFIPPFVGQLL